MFRFFRGLVHRHLGKLSHGKLIVDDAWGGGTFGDPDVADEHAVRVVVRDPRFYRAAVVGGDLGIAESLMDGHWESDQLVDLVRLFIRNREQSQWFTRGVATLRQWIARWRHFRKRNALQQAQYNIQAHYDLGNDFFQLFLDPTLCYSSGIFATPEHSLEDASREKMQRLCDLLALSPNDRVLEIGTGWGGLAETLAAEHGCRVTTTTISAEQRRFAAQRIEQAGLSSRIELLQEDYRALRGTYSKIASVEMVEAVGDAYLDGFFQHCADRLEDEGLFAMQAIVMSDALHAEYLRSVDFIRAYIFPGGCLPSISRLSQAASRAGLRLVKLHDYTPHYAETLRRWRERFQRRLPDVRGQGFDDRFIRMWDYYFCYCQAAFEERQVNLVQALFAKPAAVADTDYGHAPHRSANARSGSVRRDGGNATFPQRTESTPARLISEGPR